MVAASCVEVATSKAVPLSLIAATPGEETRPLRSTVAKEGWSGKPVTSCACAAEEYRRAAELQFGLTISRSGLAGASESVLVSTAPAAREIRSTCPVSRVTPRANPPAEQTAAALSG